MTAAPDALDARIAALEKDFAPFESPLDRYELLIEKGRALAPLPPSERIEAFRIRGCQSQVWIVPRPRDGRLFLAGDSDALITRGLVAVITGVLSGLPAAVVAGADLSFLARMGLEEHLSPTRKNGLAAMIGRIRDYARAAAQPSEP